jgi:hypothetical protein
MGLMKTPMQFNSTLVEEVEFIVKNRKIEYMDAVIMWCELNNHEIEFAGDLIRRHAVLKSKIQLEAENLNFMRKSSRLPI